MAENVFEKRGAGRPGQPGPSGSPAAAAHIWASRTHSHERRSPLTRLPVALLRGYQRWVSPALPPTCRFYPTCSAYAIDALQVHGLLRGSWLTIRRLARCHPWHPGGVDPVPPRRSRPARKNIEEQAPC